MDEFICCPLAGGAPLWTGTKKVGKGILGYRLVVYTYLVNYFSSPATSDFMTTMTSAAASGSSGGRNLALRGG